MQFVCWLCCAVYATAQGFANYLDMEQNPHLVSADGSLQPTLDKTISKQTGYIYVMDDSDDEADRDDLYNTIHQKHGTFADTGIYGDNIVADDTVEEETRKQHGQDQDQDQDQDQEGVYSMAANEKEIERTAPLHLEEEENFEEDEDGVYDNAGDDGDDGTFVYPVAVAPNSEANEGFYEGLIDADDDECWSVINIHNLLWKQKKMWQLQCKCHHRINKRKLKLI